MHYVPSVKLDYGCPNHTYWPLLRTFDESYLYSSLLN